jgi:hypothetical protein
VRVTAGLPGGEAGVVREVSCGQLHTVVAMASGEVCTFGDGGTQQRGSGRRWWPSCRSKRTESEDDFEPCYDIGELEGGSECERG